MTPRRGPPAASHALVALPAHTSAGQARLLLRLSEALAASHTLDQVSHAVMQIATQYLGADYGGVAVVEPDRRTMRYHDLQHLAGPVRAIQSFAVASSRPAAVAARENRMVLVDSVDDTTELDAAARSSARLVGGQAMAYLPMRLGHRLVGTIALMWTTPVAFTRPDEAVFAALARYAAHAVDRAQLLTERQHVATVLQQALLPRLAPIDGIDIATSYRAAGQHHEVGGDWYDAFAIPKHAHDTAMLIVGDVAGHDTQAAAYMGRIQAKLRALALDRPAAPHRLLERLERVMDVTADHRLVTAIVAAVSRGQPEGPVTLRWSNAGHPPPVLLEPGKPAQPLVTRPQPLLGLSPKPRRRTDAVTIAAGSTLLLYTDGLIDHRRSDPDDVLAALLTTIDNHREDTVHQLVQRLNDAADDTDDDTVIMAVTTKIETSR